MTPDLPEELTEAQAAKLGFTPVHDDSAPTPEAPKSYPPTEDERLGIDSGLAKPKGLVLNRGKGELFRKASGLGTEQALPPDAVPERGLVHEDPAMDIATTIAGGGAGKLAGKAVGKLSKVAGALIEPAVAGAVTSKLQGGSNMDALKSAGIGTALGVVPAALGIARRAPEAVADRLPTAITGGLKSKAAKRVVANDALDEVLAQHPELRKALATSADPAKTLATMEGTFEGLGSKTEPFYSGIDEATAAERHAKGVANVAGLSNKAAEAKRVADELGAAAKPPTRDLFEEARKIDAPPGGPEPSLFEAARRIDAPVTGKALADEGRARVAGEAAAAAGESDAARKAAEEAATHADRLTKAADQALTKLDRSPKSPGIDISAIDRNLKNAAVRLAREGRSTEALAVGRGRKQLAEMYGDNGEIPSDTVLPARSVRTLANDLGESAFTGDMTTPMPKKTLAQQRIYHAVTDEIERAAEKAGMDVNGLRSLNKQISTLIPVRTVLKQRALAGSLAGPEDPLASLVKPHGIQHKIAGLANSAPAHLDYALAASPGAQALGAIRSPIGPLATTSLMGGTAASRAQSSKQRQSDLEYAAAVSQAMQNGSSLEDAIKHVEER